MRNQMEQVANMVGRAIHHCIEAYLVMFERIMVAHKIERDL